MPAGENYDSVPVSVRRRDDQGMYELGVVIDNAFISFASIKLGHVDMLVDRERIRAEQDTPKKK